MEENTPESQQAAVESAPDTPQEAPAGEPVGEAVAPPAESAAAEPAAKAKPEAAAKPEEAPPPPEESSGLDPQLIGLAVALWVLALVILSFQWERLRIDWHLGNIKESLDMGEPVEPHAEALLGLQDSYDLLPYLDEELRNQAQPDNKYRTTMVMLAEKIDGEASFKLIQRSTGDYHPWVRAFSYMALARRAGKGGEGLRETAFQTCLFGLREDPIPDCKARAAIALGMLGDKRATWPLLRGLRDAKGDLAPLMRASCQDALTKVTGREANKIATDATQEVVDLEVMAWETWYTDQGEKIPEGDDLQSVRRAEAEAQKEVDSGAENSHIRDAPPGSPPPGDKASEGSE